METWKELIGTNYSVSDLGRVRNNKTNHILKPWKKGKYLAVNLGLANPFVIHKLVAETFLEPFEGYDIDHINRDKYDNRLVNLQYVSKSQNRCNTPALPTNLLGEKNISFNGTSYCVRIFRNGKYVMIKNFNTLSEAIQARDSFVASYY